MGVKVKLVALEEWIAPAPSAVTVQPCPSLVPTLTCTHTTDTVLCVSVLCALLTHTHTHRHTGVCFVILTHTRARTPPPGRMHVGGTMLALGLALERGWAVNIGGGMHHASADRGMGWCPFDDIMLGVRRARRAVAAAAEAAEAAEAGAGAGVAQGEGASAPAAGPQSGGEAAAEAAAAEAAAAGDGAGAGGLKVLVIDLDAHQGNGVERVSGRWTGS